MTTKHSKNNNNNKNQDNFVWFEPKLIPILNISIIIFLRKKEKKKKSKMLKFMKSLNLINQLVCHCKRNHLPL